LDAVRTALLRARGLGWKKISRVVPEEVARITSKGQITVPHEIRRALGVGPGDKLLFEKDGSGVRVRPVRTKSPFEKYRGIASPGIHRGRKAVVRWVRELRGR
jgi:AbrB family looped-hinge helix DNA binding protein